MQCPMNRVETLEFNLDKVQNGESHFLIYARDIPVISKPPTKE